MSNENLMKVKMYYINSELKKKTKEKHTTSIQIYLTTLSHMSSIYTAVPVFTPFFNYLLN